ncbi:MAG: EAL domain-containing protein [Archangium sp.]|nr:EAL domain-containing protein [Archangium sp.]
MSVRQLAALLETLPVAFVAHDSHGHVVLWNPAAEALLGWSRDEVLGRASPLPAAVTQAPVPASPSHVPLVSLKTRSGEVIEVAAASMPMTGHEASAVALWVPREAGLDAPRLRALFEHAPDGVVVVDSKGVVIEANPAMEQLLGCRAGDLTQRTVADFIESHGLPSTTNPFGVTNAETLLLRRRDGGPVTVRLTTAPIGVNRTVGFFRDITGARRNELERRLFSRVFETSGEAILITNEHNAVIAVNEAFTRITGYAVDEVLGKNPSLLQSGRHDQAFYASLWDTLKTQGSWRGELWNRRKGGEVYCEWTTINAIRDAAGAVTNYVAVFADITAVKDSQAQVTYLAQHDHLTGLPNRTLLRDRLAQATGVAQRNGQQVALMMVDLDGFKSINGTVGPYEGDTLLMEIAYRLKDAVREGDTVARMGGDEFAIVLTALDSPAQSLAVVSKVRAAIAEPLTVGGQELSLTASIGIAVFPQDGDTANVLLTHADSAMYTAKEAGRDTSRFFTEAMNTRTLDRMTLANALGRALERDEFRLQYQPQRPIVGDTLLGVEALLRWQHPELGLVPPDRFIHLAEETGAIRAIGAWVLRQAALRAKAWNLSVSVNLSVVQLQDPDFFTHVTAVLKETGVAPTLLEFEVTESVVMKDPVATAELLGRLKALGVRLSMDDFGTGYSSLAQLKRLPLDRLKIDRAFVRDVLSDPADQAVVQAVIAMGHALKLRIIAEGVETQEQRVLLAGFGCDEVQGFLCGHPVDPEEIDKERRR